MVRGVTCEFMDSYSNLPFLRDSKALITGFYLLKSPVVQRAGANSNLAQGLHRGFNDYAAS